MNTDIESTKQSGFTITELLIAVSVGAIASMLMVTAFVFTYGSVIAEQVRTQMVQESQLFLRKLSDDVRVASEIRTTNLLEDVHNPGPVDNTNGWVTSDPANILITTQPATDNTKSLIFDNSTGYPFPHEIIYFGSGDTMYRRLLINSAASGHVQVGTCPDGTTGCPPDIELVNNLEELLFEFRDIDDIVTTVPEEARSIQVTVNLKKKVYGRDLTASHTTRITLRNEN